MTSDDSRAAAWHDRGSFFEWTPTGGGSAVRIFHGSTGPADGPSQPDLVALVDDATHCPAYFQLMVRTLLLPGLAELANASTPTQLVLCEKDRVFPSPRGSRYFTTHLPKGSEVIRLDGVGHIPMLEAPGRITELIAEFVDQNTEPKRLSAPAG